MIKIGIIGADTPVSGEIIRILINHPEADLLTLYAPSLLGHSVASIHHGMIGETSIKFTNKVNPEELDLLIITSNYPVVNNIIERFSEYEDLKLISFSRNLLSSFDKEQIENGISEINRKALVRGAKIAFIPSPAVVPTMIALIPLANYLLLNSDVDIKVFLPKDQAIIIDIENDRKEIEQQLKKNQISFNGKVNLSVYENDNSERGEITEITIKNKLPIDELEKIYEGTYDDHNFTFISHDALKTQEVEGTQKTVISMEKPDAETLIINVISDSRMRGGAGDAIHVLNLFFGLHEKTGLTLKSSRFFSSI